MTRHSMTSCQMLLLLSRVQLVVSLKTRPSPWQLPKWIATWLRIHASTLWRLMAIKLSTTMLGLRVAMKSYGIWCIMMCSSLVVWYSTVPSRTIKSNVVLSPRWLRVRVRPWWLPCQYSSMLWPTKACMWWLSMIISLSVTRSGWDLFICSMDWQWTVSTNIVLTPMSVVVRMLAMSRLVPTMSLVLIISAIIWLLVQWILYSADTIMPSWMRWTLCWLTMRVHHWLSVVLCQKAKISFLMSTSTV